jgi:hypothetical protein
VWYAAADAHAILVVSLRKVGLGTLWSNWWTTLFRQQKRVEGGAHDGAGSRASVGSTCQSKREENVLEEREDANDIFSLILCKMHVHNASVGDICIALKCRSAMHNAYACPFASPVGLNLRITFFMISYSHLRILQN